MMMMMIPDTAEKVYSLHSHLFSRLADAKGLLSLQNSTRSPQLVFLCSMRVAIVTYM